MKIQYAIQKHDGTFISEENLAADFENLKGEILQMESLTGAILIENDKDKLVIKDELAALIHNFCLESLSGIITNKNARYNFYEVHGSICFEVIEDFLLITGDYIGEILVPCNEFIHQSYLCAERYNIFLAKLDSAKHIYDLKQLKETAATTHDFLEEINPSLLKG